MAYFQYQAVDIDHHLDIRATRSDLVCSYLCRLEISAEQYYSVVAGGKTGLLAHYAYSATNVRLRECSISYMLPQNWFNNKLNVSLSLTAHNLFMFYNKAPFDPELTANTGTYYQGFDYFMPPSQRSMGFGVKVNF